MQGFLQSSSPIQPSQGLYQGITTRPSRERPYKLCPLCAVQTVGVRALTLSVVNDWLVTAPILQLELSSLVMEDRRRRFEHDTNSQKSDCILEEEVMTDVFSELANIEATPPTKRPFCERCCRPVTACWCPYLPCEPIDVSTTVWILQHPLEESRCLRTAPMLYHGLKAGQCHIVRGKRFSKERHPEVWRTLQDPETLLLYPGPDASDLSDLPCHGRSAARNLVILDGTWSQAKGLYHQNPALRNLTKVQIQQSGCSKYVIRSQPSDSCLSTLETAAIALSILEDRPCLQELLTRPLVALCDFQLQHGAVRHQSKEYQIQAGTYTKALPRSVLRRRAEQQQQQQRQEL